jgi:hypothetical protein
MKSQIMKSLNFQKEAAFRSTRKVLPPEEEAIQPHLMEALSRQQLQALMELRPETLLFQRTGPQYRILQQETVPDHFNRAGLLSLTQAYQGGLRTIPIRIKISRMRSIRQVDLNAKQNNSNNR